MGSYTFSWEHPANEVFVTGDFDQWKQTIKLEKEDGAFKKTVDLPREKHQYKFVVDGSWLTNDSHPKESDGSGNFNNVLYPEDIKDGVSTLSSAAPQSTTASLAGVVPKESQKPETEKSKSDESIPGAFPLTPPAATPGSEPQAFSVNPLPATEGLGNPIKLAPGEPIPDPSTFTNNTIHSTVNDNKEPEEEKVSVAPIPATTGAGNPIHLAPGEKVPDASTLTTNTIQSTANTDAASYEKSDALPPQLGPVVTPEAEREAKGGMFALPPLAGSLIPESSLPKDADVETEKDSGVTIQSAAPTSTTATLAGQVPKEPRSVPEAETEKDSEVTIQSAAPTSTTATLAGQVPKEPRSVPEAETEKDSEVTIQSAAPTSTTAALAGQVPKESRSVPEAVTESQQEAKFPPEAAANPEAVQEKSAVEQELKEKVPEEPPAAESTLTGKAAASADTATAGATAAAGAFAAAAYSAKEKAAETIGYGQPTQAPVSNGQVTASEVPAVVTESQKEAHVSPEASANSEAVEEKKAVESELLEKVGHTSEAGEPASTVPDIVAESQKEAHVSPEASANEEAVEEKKAVEEELLQQSHTTGNVAVPVPAVPEVVAESQKQAHVDPEASANKEAVEEKKEVESELLQQVKKTNEAGEPAPTETAATSATAPGLSDDALTDSKPLKSSSEPDALNAGADKPALPTTDADNAAQPVPSIPVDSPSDSRDVSPMSKQPTKATEQGQPAVTTGAESSKIPSQSSPEAPKKETPSSATATPESATSSTTDKKKKRTSIFGKLKAKLSSKH